jgi:Cytochrome c3
MKRKTLTLIILSCFSIYANASIADAFQQDNVKSKNSNCLRCHSMTTLGYYDQESGIFKNLSVNPKEFYNSNHKNLACVNCHSKEFENFPHPAELKKENLYCLNCHKDNPELLKFNFTSIEKDFKKSVHHQKLGDKFTCFNCHDPHTFKINARENFAITSTVHYDNRICLQCHNNQKQIASLTSVEVLDLNSAHQWLPHADLHWKNVRCIDCHTGVSNAGISHLILPKEKALKNCVNCHSSNSVLLQSLYKFKVKEARNKEGFINAVILNNSYVIGATRNFYLNFLSFIFFGLVLAAIIVHGSMRIYLKKTNHQNDEVTKDE